MTLQSEIKSWNGKSASDITAIYSNHASTKDFLPKLIELTNIQDLQAATTWLLKHHLEQTKQSLSSQHSAELCRLLPEIKHWEARLHVLQTMHLVQIKKSHAKRVERFVIECFTIENKFVRAWAYNGYYELAKAHPEYQDEATAMLNDAIKTESAASVLARVRKLIKAGFPKA